jgi:putative lipoprotein
VRFAIVLSLAAGTGRAADGWVGHDKWKHLVASALLQSATYSVVRAAGGGHGVAQGIAIPAALGVGLAKEVRDRRPGGSGFSTRDLAWDLAGVGLGAVAAHQVR